MEYIVVNNLFKRFGEIQALRGVNFSVHQGETFGLIGHNGAGKTTTMRIILGLLKPDEGYVLMDGHVIAEKPRLIWRTVGYVAEEEGYYDYLNAYEYLDLFGRFYNLSGGDVKKKAQELLEMMGMKGYAGRKVGSYSRGMRRRLSIVRSLLHNPTLLIFDSITEGLSPEAAHEMRDLMRNLACNLQKTILFSSHNLWEVERVCDRIALMKSGRVIFEGTIKELKREVGAQIKAKIRIEGLSENKAEKVLSCFSNDISIKMPKADLVFLECDVTSVAKVLNALTNEGITASLEEVYKTTLEDIYMKLIGEANDERNKTSDL
jgi:ABC-2 type transport system ATP-binding protein